MNKTDPNHQWTPRTKNTLIYYKNTQIYYKNTLIYYKNTLIYYKNTQISRFHFTASCWLKCLKNVWNCSQTLFLVKKYGGKFGNEKVIFSLQNQFLTFYGNGNGMEMLKNLIELFNNFVFCLKVLIMVITTIDCVHQLA